LNSYNFFSQLFFEFVWSDSKKLMSWKFFSRYEFLLNIGTYNMKYFVDLQSKSILVFSLDVGIWIFQNFSSFSIFLFFQFFPFFKISIQKSDWFFLAFLFLLFSVRIRISVKFWVIFFRGKLFFILSFNSTTFWGLIQSDIHQIHIQSPFSFVLVNQFTNGIKNLLFSLLWGPLSNLNLIKTFFHLVIEKREKGPIWSMQFFLENPMKIRQYACTCFANVTSLMTIL